MQPREENAAARESRIIYRHLRSMTAALRNDGHTHADADAILRREVARYFADAAMERPEPVEMEVARFMDAFHDAVKRRRNTAGAGAVVPLPALGAAKPEAGRSLPATGAVRRFLEALRAT